MNAGIGATRAITASNGLSAMSSAIIDTKAIAVWIRPNTPLTRNSGRVEAPCWARRSRSYEVESSKNARSSLAAWAITWSWIVLVTRSWSSCWQTLRRVPRNELSV